MNKCPVRVGDRRHFRRCGLPAHRTRSGMPVCQAHSGTDRKLTFVLDDEVLIVEPAIPAGITISGWRARFA